MSFQKTTYGEASGSCSAESYGAGGYNTWGKISVSCYTKGSTLHVTMKSSTSNYPYLRVCFAVNGTTVYDSGYRTTNSSSWPRGDGTSYSATYPLPNTSSNPTIQVGIGVSTSTITWGSKVTLTRPKYNWYWNDINAWNLEATDQNGAKFDVYYSYQNKTYPNVTNEPNSLFGPLNSWMRVFNVRALNNTQEVYKIEGYDGREENFSSDNKDGLPCYTDADGYDSWWQYNDTGTGSINIYTRYKVSILKTNLNYNDDTEDEILGNVQYNSTNRSKILPPIRVGYKFLGWFTARSGGTQTHDANGNYIAKSGYWEGNGVFKGITDLTLYAQWEIQNVCYIKQDNEWKLATIYIKIDNEWKPAIMYIKTDNGWEQSGP